MGQMGSTSASSRFTNRTASGDQCHQYGMSKKNSWGEGTVESKFFYDYLNSLKVLQQGFTYKNGRGTIFSSP